MIRLLTTYLFKEQQHLIDWYVRDLEETIQSWTLDFVPGHRLAEIPVYVLTSDVHRLGGRGVHLRPPAPEARRPWSATPPPAPDTR